MKLLHKNKTSLPDNNQNLIFVVTVSLSSSRPAVSEKLTCCLPAKFYTHTHTHIPHVLLQWVKCTQYYHLDNKESLQVDAGHHLSFKIYIAQIGMSYTFISFYSYLCLAEVLILLLSKKYYSLLYWLRHLCQVNQGQLVCLKALSFSLTLCLCFSLCESKPTKLYWCDCNHYSIAKAFKCLNSTGE